MATRRSDASDLIDGLNEDLANEYASVIQYRTFASTLRGPHRLTLRSLFEGEIPDELGHAGVLADYITALGGSPTTMPAEVPTADSPLEMLRTAYDAEVQAIARYVERRSQAEEAGEHGIAVSLDDIIEDETRHRDEMQLIIEGWEAAGQSRSDSRGTEHTSRAASRARPARTRGREIAGSSR
ncbi:MAG TPA: ferritin-like domain-containing protein [Gemmatimonadaceae bacterium]|jgi:bacterioferritin|nr:ferritin-like domain-containing protein [Gemmatimonadaceae bacterium]